MADPIDLLIKEIAIKHGVAVSRDDPILIMQTLNTLLVDQNRKAQQIMLNQFKEEMELISMRWSRDAKDKSERILNASLMASKEAMSNLLQESAKTTALTIQQNIEEQLSRTSNALRHTGRIALINLITSVLILFSVGMFVIGLFR